jgi:hypothetical protein
LKSAFVENTVAAMARRSLNHVRILAAALVALLTFGATFIATGAEDADSTINAMSEAHKQFRIPMSNHDLEPRIEAFLVNFFASRSSSDVKSLKVLEEFYADDIMHLSKRIRREIVMNDLRKSSVQWPERSYQMRPQTFRIECFDPTDTVKFPTCKAVGFVRLVGIERRGARVRGGTL